MTGTLAAIASDLLETVWGLSLAFAFAVLIKSGRKDLVASRDVWEAMHQDGPER